MDCQWVLGSTYWNTSWSKANVFQNFFEQGYSFIEKIYE